MEGVKTYQDTAKEIQDKKIEDVRAALRKAAEIKNPEDMWYVVRDILNLLTLLIVPAPQVVTSEDLARAEAMQG